jgi:hypothetical protein
MSKEETQFGGPRAPTAKKPHGTGHIGRDRARKMKIEAAKQAIIQKATPQFAGDRLAFFESIFRDATQPLERRMQACRDAERIAAATTKETKAVKKGLEELVNEAFGKIRAADPLPAKPAPEPPVEVLLIQADIDNINRVIADADQRIRQFQFAGDTEKAAEVRRIKDEALAYHRKLLTARDRAYHAK